MANDGCERTARAKAPTDQSRGGRPRMSLLRGCAAAALALYAIAGVAGLPWFAGGTAGYASASFGYIVGFFFAATACGYLAGRGADRSVLKSVPAMVAAEVIIYAFGLTWLALDLHLGASATLSDGLTPFLAGDAIKAAIAAGLLPLVWWKLPARRQDSRPAHDESR